MPNGPKGTNRRPYMVLKKYYDYVTPPRTSLPAGSTVRLRFKNQARTTAGVTVPHAYGEPQPYETRRPLAGITVRLACRRNPPRTA